MSRTGGPVAELDANAFGEVLEPGRVPDCYLGLLLPPGPAGELEAGTVLVVAPAACCIVGFPSRPGAWSMSCSPATPNESPVSWYSWPDRRATHLVQRHLGQARR